MAGPSPFPVVPFPRQVVLGCVRELDKPAGEIEQAAFLRAFPCKFLRAVLLVWLWFVLNLIQTYTYLGRGSLNFINAFTRLACDAFSWLWLMWKEPAHCEWRHLCAYHSELLDKAGWVSQRAQVSKQHSSGAFVSVPASGFLIACPDFSRWWAVSYKMKWTLLFPTRFCSWHLSQQ